VVVNVNGIRVYPRQLHENVKREAQQIFVVALVHSVNISQHDSSSDDETPSKTAVRSETIQQRLLNAKINLSLRDKDRNLLDPDVLDAMSPYEIRVHYHNVALTVLCERHIPYRVDFEDPRYYIIEQNPSVDLIQYIVDESTRRYGHHHAHVRREQERKLEDECSSGSELEESLAEIVQRFHDHHKRVREETRRIDARARGGAGSPDELDSDDSFTR
jgi:hypothetical protein